LDQKDITVFIEDVFESLEIEYYGNRAIRCLDLSKVAPSVLLDVGIESGLLLKEVLDRIEIPPL
jgi:hypothetical protein